MVRRKKFDVLFEFLMVTAGALMFYPVIMMMIVSLKNDMLLASEPLSLKASLAFENYKTAIDGMGCWRVLMNSTTLTVSSALLTAFFGACSAYIITRVKRGRKLFIALDILFLVGLALPEQVVMVPLVLRMQKLGVGSTLLGLILASIGASAAYGISFFSGFVNTVSVTFEETAFIDGAGRMKTFLTVVLPLLKPSVVALLIAIALRVWNNFMYPLLLLQSKNSRTLLFTVLFFKGDLSIQWNILFIVTTLVILPLLIVCFLLQKQIISDMLSGSIKG